MPRPRRGVTLANLIHVDRYFQQALKNNKLFIHHTNLETHYAAKDAFQQLPAIDWKNESTKKDSMAKRQVELQAWIDKYIPPAKWQRCLLTLRQNKSRKKLKLRRLDLQLDVYLTLKTLAKKQNATIGETIHRLAKPALEKVYKKELADEQKIRSS